MGYYDTNKLPDNVVAVADMQWNLFAMRQMVCWVLDRHILFEINQRIINSIKKI